MRLRPAALLVFATTLLTLSSASVLERSRPRQLAARHGDEHGHGITGSKPLEHINETEILQYHDRDPTSYYQYDFEGAVVPDAELDALDDPVGERAKVVASPEGRHGTLAVLHALVMVASYLLLLPIVIVMKSTGHRLLWFTQSSFWALNLIGWSLARAYKRATPNLYKGSTHGKSGNVLLLLSLVITFIDLVPSLKRRVESVDRAAFIDAIRVPKWVHSSSWIKRINPFGGHDYLPVVHPTDTIALSPDSAQASPTEYEEDEEDPRDEIDMLVSEKTAFNRQSSSYHNHPHLVKRHSIGSDHSTLHEHEIQLPITPITPSPPKVAKSLAAKAVLLVQLVVMVVERSLVIYGWGQMLSGLTIYWGFGRSQYINGILAHFIKGSIFWGYGILTFSRYLGAWSRWGWGWNTLFTSGSKSKPWSAAFVESLVIFTYGFTQQFMERFGKNPGDPYTAKDIEHISIAVMFWGGGLVGMAVESPKIRGWIFGEEEEVAPKEEDTGLSSPKGRASPHTRKGSDIHHHHPHHQHHPSNTTLVHHYQPSQPQQSQPRTVSPKASNPLPALVIGVTGLAMSAHHQTYLFQVQIHALWGYLLVGFAICRCLTCFFEWVRPAHDTSTSNSSVNNKRHGNGSGAGGVVGKPGLPPTELVGSIFLGAGGFVFICSDEQITFWAMRTGRDDMMMFLNLAIAFTCVAYVWTTIILIIAGTSKKKTHL
ncbi:hypothetical protein CPB86DRAFT_780552 [Serendipita vermifera]|nr:hypothetical protein CPB86DRAFT_780552 [Serendipita vermifera]